MTKKIRAKELNIECQPERRRMPFEGGWKRTQKEGMKEIFMGIL
jgi:hypothetical protein